MRIKNIITKRGVALAWLFSYLVLLVMPIVIGFVVFLEAREVLTEQITQANSLLLEQAKELTDNKISGIREFAQQISAEPVVRRLANMKGKIPSNEQMEIQSFQRNILRMKHINDYADEIYIFFKGLDRAVGTLGIMDNRLLYEIFYRETGMTEEQWEYFLNKKHTSSLVSLPENLESKNIEGEGVVAYLQPLPVHPTDSNAAVMVVIINKQRFMNMVERMPWKNSGTVLILSDSNNVILSTNEIETKNLSWKEVGGREGGIYTDDNKEDIIVYTFSNVERIKYVSVVPKSIFWQDMNYIKRILLAATSFLIVAGGILSAYFMARNYAPIREIMMNITQKSQVNFEKKENEYTYIKNRIEAVFSRNEKIEDQLKKQVDIIKNDFLVKLLRGKVEDEVYARNFLETYNIKYTGDSFLVIIFYIENYNRLFGGIASMSASEKLATGRFMITNVVDELISRDRECTMVEMDENVMAYIVNFNEDEQRDIMEQIKEALNHAQEFLGENFHLSFSSSVSGINKSFWGLANSYSQAVETVEYIRMFGTHRIAYYDDMQKPKNSYNYALEKESMLINHIKDGDFEKSSEVLTEIFETSFEDGDISLELGKCLIFSVLSSIIKAAGDLGDSAFIDSLRPVSTISECKTLDEIKGKMSGILKQFCEQINSEDNQSYNLRLAILVSKYVKENYNDPNLSVRAVGEHFEMTPHYLSRLFKEQTGEGLYNYINKVRLEKAKQLLRQNGVTVEVCARETGYLSSVAFIRAFKKYEGITPGKYKELNH